MHAPLQSELYAAAEDLQSKLTVASDIIKKNPGKYHPVVLAFPTMRNLIKVVNLTPPKITEIHAWAEANAFDIDAIQDDDTSGAADASVTPTTSAATPTTSQSTVVTVDVHATPSTDQDPQPTSDNSGKKTPGRKTAAKDSK